MLDDLAKIFTIAAAAKYINLRQLIKNFIGWLICGLVFILLIVVGLIASCAAVGLICCALFVFGFMYALVYGKAPLLSSSISLFTATALFVYEMGLPVVLTNFWFAATLFLFLFSLFTFPFVHHPPIKNSYNGWRFVFVFIYTAMTTCLWILTLNGSGFGLLAGIFGIGGFFLNRLFFGRFQWRHLQGYAELETKYGKVLSDRDAKLFGLKLESRFGKDWCLVTERDNPNNTWADRIMFAYLNDQLNKVETNGLN